MPLYRLWLSSFFETSLAFYRPHTSPRGSTGLPLATVHKAALPCSRERWNLVVSRCREHHLNKARALPVLWYRCLSYSDRLLVISFIERFLVCIWIKKPTSDSITALHPAGAFKMQLHLIFLFNCGVFFLKTCIVSTSVCPEKISEHRWQTADACALV